MKIDILVLGMIRTNCYILSDENTKEAILIDPADESERILSFLSEQGYKLKAILLTHGHFDHITGIQGVRDTIPVPLYALEAEKELLENPQWNCSNMGSRSVSEQADQWLLDGDVLTFGTMSCKVIATPGHTRGSGCYYFEKENVLFSGDTLFCESVGRTDLPTGNAQMVIESVRKKLLVLPENTIVYPGHGAETSIGYERRNNPYADGNGWE